jgi:para-nitrobenzyl esterase
MVWFHGGGWNTGSGMSYTADGGPLVKKGVVLVTVNYRLGVFGSLAHPELTAESPQKASGNYGFLDQQAALRWVQDNIRAFGGDPRRVTIFGESAGSWSVNVLVASPLSAGLFHRAIGQSGGRFEPAPHLTEERYKLKSGEQRGLDYAAALDTESLDDLRTLSADQLLSIPFRGQEIIDGWVLPDDVRTIFSEGRQNHVPVIVGSNGSEATAFFHPTWPTTLQEYRQHVNAEYGQYAKAFFAAYPVNSLEDIPAAMYGARRDWRFAWPMRSWARATTAAEKTPAYLYDFSYVPPHPWSEDLGAYHTAEIPYVFDHLTTSRVSASWYLKERDYQLAQIMSSYWVNFATTGDPNSEGLPQWEPYNLTTEPYLDFGEIVQLSHRLRPIKLDFVEEYLASKYGIDY